MKTSPDTLDWSDAEATARGLAALDRTLEPITRPQRLQGGLLNYVWRVSTRLGDRIVKVAPPFVASAPDIPLDPQRSAFEARALVLFSADGPFARLAGDDVRPPRLVRYFPEASLLVLEDLGDVPSLQIAAPRGVSLERSGTLLASFIGALHAASSRLPDIEPHFRNIAIQTTRARVQYQGVAKALIARYGSKYERLARAMDNLGERLLKKGRCLVMGDLWPASVLLDGPRVRLIDWEFAHFGQALQDVAHLMAHTWMLRHRSTVPPAARALESFERAFLETYRASLGETAAVLWDDASRRDANLHYAAEILVRTIGAFQAGGLYSEMEEAEPAIEEAVHHAVDVAEGRRTGWSPGDWP